jgi:hypothetical protein
MRFVGGELWEVHRDGMGHQPSRACLTLSVTMLRTTPTWLVW